MNAVEPINSLSAAWTDWMLGFEHEPPVKSLNYGDNLVDDLYATVAQRLRTRARVRR
jgi:hypothetical protein